MYNSRHVLCNVATVRLLISTYVDIMNQFHVFIANMYKRQKRILQNTATPVLVIPGALGVSWLFTGQ